MLSFKGIFNDGTVVEYEKYNPPSSAGEIPSNPEEFELYQNTPIHLTHQQQ